MNGPLTAFRRAIRRQVPAVEVVSDRLWARSPVLIAVPLVIAGVTVLANASDVVPFLLFPPLAAGTYVLFQRPERAAPGQFVVGVTAGAASGWLAVLVTDGSVLGLRVSPAGAALSVFLTAVVTIVIGVDEPMAFSTALLVLVTGATEVVYFLSVAATSLLVAGLFVLYRDRVYEPGERYLHRSRPGETVLVALWNGDAVAHFGARLAGNGRLVLLAPADGATANIAERTERLAERLEDRYDVACEVVVVPAGDRAERASAAAVDLDADIVVVPVDSTALDEFERLTRETVDVVGLHSPSNRSRWRRALVGRPRSVAPRITELAARGADAVRSFRDTGSDSADAAALIAASGDYDLLVVDAETGRSVLWGHSGSTGPGLDATADVAVVGVARK